MSQENNEITKKPSYQTLKRIHETMFSVKKENEKETMNRLLELTYGNPSHNFIPRLQAHFEKTNVKIPDLFRQIPFQDLCKKLGGVTQKFVNTPLDELLGLNVGEGADLEMLREEYGIIPKEMKKMNRVNDENNDESETQLLSSFFNHSKPVSKVSEPSHELSEDDRDKSEAPGFTNNF